MKNHLNILFFALTVGLPIGLFLALPVSAATALSLKTWNSDLQLNKSVGLVKSDFPGVVDFATIDLGRDGVSEIVVSEGYQAVPLVKILRIDGSLINSWQPYGPGFEGKVVVATGDLDNDGKDEIVTAPGAGGGPHIRIFDGYGVAEGRGFFVADKANRSGVEIAVGDVDNDGRAEIVASYLDGQDNYIKIFDNAGKELSQVAKLSFSEIFEPAKVFVNNSEVIIASGAGTEPRVWTYSATGTQLNTWLAYDSSFKGGFDITAGKFNGKNVIVTMPGFGGGAHVKIFDTKGILANEFFAYDSSFIGGASIAFGNFGTGSELLTLPQLFYEADGQGVSSLKMIRVDISEQRLWAYERGRVVKSFLISSGRKGFDTPIGQFSVYRKKPLVTMSWFYGVGNKNNYNLPNVPNMLSFKGPYTLHGAYWHHNWGHRMSHGCVNISVKESKWLYDFTPIGTPVIIQN